jgi:hypothetical protein
MKLPTRSGAGACGSPAETKESVVIKSKTAPSRRTAA